jgi:ectoine hydroxylase-related dioxygenase (phytanoyl-CoA dioxygenase family)
MSELPELTSDYVVPAEAIAAYRRDGHVHLPGVLAPAEVAAYRPCINAAADRYKGPQLPLEQRTTYAKAFLQIMNLWRRDEAVKRYVLARRFGSIAAQLMGVPGVRLYHDQALFKEPQGGHTPWHQDQYYWPLATDHTITMWMPMVDLTADMGILTFASGSQQRGYLGAIPISDHSEELFRNYVREQGFRLWSVDAMAAGDATFHSGWTLHAAPPNRSARMREVMTLILYADGARTMTPDNPNRVRDLANWLPGCQPGDLAVSPLNPLLYP